jgi:sugar phosphate isomerase/epimerase
LKLSVSTGTLYIYPLRCIFRMAARAGFDGVELVVNPEMILRGGQAVRQLAAEEGVEILSVHPTVVPLPGWRERRGGIGPTIRFALEAGVGVVVLHTPRSESLDQGEGLAFRQQVERWQQQLAGTGLRLAIENKAVRTERDRHYALTPLNSLRAFAEDHDLGLVLDTTHAGTAGEDLLLARQVLDGRLANVHLSDMGGRLPLARVPTVWKLVGQHRFPGAGDLALAALLADLRDQGYGGPLTLEMNPFAARFWWPPAAQRRLARAAAWMRRGVDAARRVPGALRTRRTIENAGPVDGKRKPEPGPTAQA